MNDTQPTPETDAVADKAFNFLNDGDIEAVEADFARKLERERDEARDELARMQTMAASVADIIAKRGAMLEAIREAHTALKELRSFYIAMTNLPPCAANAALAKLQPFLP